MNVTNVTMKAGTRCDMCDMDMDMDMKMWFHFGNTETVLFESWTFDTDGGLIGSAIGIFFLAMFYEAFKFGRDIFAQKMQKCTKDSKQTMFNMPHGVQTLMHAIQFILSYFLMFIFMTFNVWLCLAVILGGGVGYFLFGWKKTSVGDLTEHCH
ncbi:high affinity copper uptake protein 1-like [Atheta coriaria]|uniref:high affinity copper uptake protein 1-like n=1 Tax=Dalotia coriaria TaxID=877792 RepID=UPI0031F3D432